MAGGELLAGAGTVAGAAAGAAPGLGTVAAAVLADTAGVLSLAARSVAATALYYGYDPHRPEEEIFMLSVIGLGMAYGTTAKTAAYAEVSQLTQLPARNAPWAKLNEKVLTKVAQQFAAKFGQTLTKKTGGKLTGTVEGATPSAQDDDVIDVIELLREEDALPPPDPRENPAVGEQARPPDTVVMPQEIRAPPRLLWYTVRGMGFPVLALAGRNAVERAAVGDGGDQPADRVRRAVSDDRDGPAQGRQSAGPLETGDPWGAYAADQLAVMDHLGIGRFLAFGCCIGGPFILKLCQLAPERVVAAVLEQPVGITSANREMFDTGRTTTKAELQRLA